MTHDELREAILETRARQAAVQRSGVPEGVKLGPLTSTIRDGAAWSTEDQFPSDQTWADEVERVLSFAQVQGQFENYVGALRGNARQRHSALAELRVAFFFSRNHFPVVEWKPVGANGREGEFTVKPPSGANVFVEVKSPSWEGELSDAEKTGDRKQQGKHLHAEARSIAPWERVQFAVNKGYGKFRSDTRNLLVIADDLFVSLEHGTNLQAGLYSVNNNGSFTSAARQNLGGVSFFWIKNNLREVWYEMKLFLNTYALSAVAIPEEFASAFHASDHS
ncbi:MAG: hypothetical protein HY735_37910 [Verrucomicrobia bacterium]|nr:hypothetical protein [Verrucomicrobiota bacterium]